MLWVELCAFGGGSNVPTGVHPFVQHTHHQQGGAFKLEINHVVFNELAAIAWSDVVTTRCRFGCTGQRSKSLVQLIQVAFRLFNAPLFGGVTPNAFQVCQGRRCELEVRHAQPASGL